MPLQVLPAPVYSMEARDMDDEWMVCLLFLRVWFLFMAEAQGLAQQPARIMNRMNESAVAVRLGGHRPVLRAVLRWGRFCPGLRVRGRTELMDGTETGQTSAPHLECYYHQS